MQTGLQYLLGVPESATQLHLFHLPAQLPTHGFLSPTVSPSTLSFLSPSPQRADPGSFMAATEQTAQQVQQEPPPETESQQLGRVGSVFALALDELVQEVGSLQAATQPTHDNVTALN